MSGTKEQIGRLESLLERVRSRARHANGASAAAKASVAPASAEGTSPTQKMSAIPQERPSSSDLAVPVHRPSAAPYAGHQGQSPASVRPPASVAPASTMEIGPDDMIESGSPVPPAAARAPSVAPPSVGPASSIPASRHETVPPGPAQDDIEVEVGAVEVDVSDEELIAPSSSRRPRSERAEPYHERDSQGARPQTMPPESGRQVAQSQAPSVPAESGKRQSVAPAHFDASHDAAPASRRSQAPVSQQSAAATNQVASGRAAEANAASFVGAPRRAATFGELLDAALSL